MAEASRHDAWQAGDRYDAYMGRWSRQLAPRFLDWLGAADGLDWLEVGCGTGALSAAIVARCNPKSLVAIDPSEGFVAAARAMVSRPARARSRAATRRRCRSTSASRDVVVSALVLNFVPDRPKALAEMKRVARPGGTVAFYVWDYPGGGMEFMRAFWTAASALDPARTGPHRGPALPVLHAGRADRLAARTPAWRASTCAPIEVPTVFRDFDDFWRPFTLGAGPAPGYCASLDRRGAAAPEGQAARQSLPRRRGRLDRAQGAGLGGEGGRRLRRAHAAGGMRSISGGCRSWALATAVHRASDRLRRARRSRDVN